jgi:acyl-CoA synthetase (AMP-forming)/AMP-acid ligase II
MTTFPYSMRLLERLVRHATERPEGLAYRDACSGATLTYRQLLRRAATLAQRLIERLKPESVVMICCPNTIEFPVAFLGCMAAGCATFLISTDSPVAELKDLAERGGVVCVIAQSEDLKSVTAKVSIPLSELDAETETNFTATPAAGTNARLLLLSSGSTGIPKIVCRSGDAVDAVADQIATTIGLNSGDGILALVPLYHAYGIEHQLLAPIWVGASVHLCRGLDLSLVQRELSGRNITMLPGVPSMFEMLAQLGNQGARLPTLRAAYSAGGPLPLSVSEAFTARYGVRVGQLYGASEFGSITYGDPQDSCFEPTTVGQPMAGVKIRIIDEQVWITADSMFNGYLGESETPIVDGFFPTGDLGRLDPHGNLTITGRIKLMVDIGGQKVNPLEVENILLQHPMVADCVVVTVRQSETVLRLKAIITSKVSRIDVDDVRRFAQQRLAGYKVPRVFEVRESLPRSPTGKILRHLVQA